MRDDDYPQCLLSFFIVSYRYCDYIQAAWTLIESNDNDNDDDDDNNNNNDKDKVKPIKKNMYNIVYSKHHDYQF